MLLQNRRTKETFPLSSLRLLSWVPYTASLWSLVYGLLGLYWAVGGPGFPFGEHDVKAAEMGALFINVRAPEAGPLIAVLGILGTLNALAMTRLWRSRLVALCLLTFAYGACALLILVIPDGRVLMYVGYFLTLHPGQMDGVLLNQFACLLGGLLWALTALIYQRKSRSACLHCARTTSIAATRGISWGYLLTIIAIAMPLLYTLTRWAWALGIPLGMSWLPPSSPLEVGLGAAAAGGALLTLGLIQRWGECFPSFLPLLGGRSVPPALAIIPASLVSVILISAGVTMWRVTIAMALGLIPRAASVTVDNWGAFLGNLAWLPWGLALAGATLAYSHRRRGRCHRCDQQ